jgi:hypothetical protein
MPLKIWSSLTGSRERDGRTGRLACRLNERRRAEPPVLPSGCSACEKLKWNWAGNLRAGWQSAQAHFPDQACVATLRRLEAANGIEMLRAPTKAPSPTRTGVPRPIISNAHGTGVSR